MGKLLSIFTTATAGGVSTRYITVIIGTALTVAGLLGWLTPEQVSALREAVPTFLAAAGAVVAAGVPIYAALTKSSSDKAAEAARQIDAKLPKSAPVEIVTPGSTPNIKVPAEPASSGR